MSEKLPKSYNKKHHQKLPLAELRDLIAEEDRNPQAWIMVRERETMREHLEEAVRKAQAELAAYNRGTAMMAVLDRFGWEVYDVSDHVDYDARVYRGFIGTREELKEIYPEAYRELEEDA